MELTWYGLSCFKMTERGYASVVADPYNGKKVGLPELKLKADVVTISHDAAGHNYLAGVSGHQHQFTGPGEYEVGGTFVTGTASPRKSTEEQKNTSFVFEFNNITIAHLGDLNKVPSQTQIDAMGEINILLLPVGGGNSLNAAQASEVVSMLEPNIVVPMHFGQDNLKLDLEGVDRFLKEMGVSPSEPENSLKISASSLPEETQIKVLEPKI